MTNLPLKLPLKLPLSGSEEPFTNTVYGRWGKKSNNCFGYAIDWFRGNGSKKLQPGEISKTLTPGDDLTNVKTLKARVISDLETKKNGGYATSPCVKCKQGFYKIMAFVDPGVDYHFLKQVGDMVVDTNGKNARTLAKNMDIRKINIPDNSNKALAKKTGLWAHKRGLAELTTKDASGKFITDPRKADLKYENIHYSTYAGTFCVNVHFGKGEKFSCT